MASKLVKVQSIHNASDNQASFLIAKTIKDMQESLPVTLSEKAKAYENRSLETPDYASYATIGMKEDRSGFEVQLDYYEKVTNPKFVKDTEKDDKGSIKGNIYNQYIISQSQLDDFVAQHPESGADLYRLMAKYEKAGDMNIRFGPEQSPYRISKYRGKAFDMRTIPDDTAAFRPSERLEEYKDSLTESYDACRKAYFDEHVPMRIAYTATQTKINPSVGTVIRVKDVTPEDIERAYAATGVMPKLQHGYDVDAVEDIGLPIDPQYIGNDASQDHYIYDTCYKIIPALGLDDKSIAEARKNPVSNPYLVDYYTKGDGDKTQRLHRDLLIDPVYMMKLAENSKYECSADRKMYIGVTNTTAYYHDHPFTRSEKTSADRKAVSSRTVFGDLTENRIAEPDRPAVPYDKIVGPSAVKPPKGCTFAVRLKFNEPQGEDAIIGGKDYTINHMPAVPYDDKKQKQFMAVSVSELKKRANQASIAKTMNAASEVDEKNASVSPTLNYGD